MIRVLKTNATSKADYAKPLANRKVERAGRRYNTKLSMDDARAIREAHAAKRASMETLSIQYGLSKACIFNIIHGKSYRETGRDSHIRAC